MTGTHRRLGVAAALVDGVVVPGDVAVDGATIAATGLAPAGRRGLAVAGYIDLQVNAWRDIDLRSTSADGYAAAARGLAATGTTAWLPTFPTAPIDSLTTALRTAAPVLASPVADGAVPLGIHLEGPFLEPLRAGAHPKGAILDPDLAILRDLVALAPVRLVTLAAERDGASDLVDWLVASGIVVSLGHTEATAAQAHEAFDRGVRMHTHVWNAHRRLTSRDPGSGAVALRRADVTPCLIADLCHVAPDTLAVSLAAASSRYVLVSDAGLGVGLPDGTTVRSGRAEVTVDAGACRLADGTLAGSATTLDGAVRNAVAIGRPLDEVLDAVTRRPAALLGLRDRGDLRPGLRADVVVLDDALYPTTVLVGGRQVSTSD